MKLSTRPPRCRARDYRCCVCTNRLLNGGRSTTHQTTPHHWRSITVQRPGIDQCTGCGLLRRPSTDTAEEKHW